MIDEFPINIEIFEAGIIPEPKTLFKVERSNPLKNNKAGLFHTTVDRGLLLCKIERLDIHTTILVLCTRVKHTKELGKTTETY